LIARHVQITLALLLIAVVGIGLYLYRLERKTEEETRRASDMRSVAPPVNGPMGKITLAIAYDEDGVFRQQQAQAALPADAGERSREILRALFSEYMQRPSPHPLAAGSDINDVYVISGDLAVVDTNGAFADSHPSGVMVEDFTLFSMIETLSLNVPEIKRVKIIVNGRERSTLAGHADLSPVFDVASIHQAVESLR
jgi:sporulation and spore germination protein